jgi:hypothetical protein
MEEWKNIEGYSGYKISNQGRVFSNKLKRVIQPPQDKDGYYRIGLWNKQVVKKYRVHRLVAIAFVANPDNLSIVNHKNGNKQNNFVENLEWCTVAQNEQHSRLVLGKTTPKGIHTKPITIVKDGVEKHFPMTKEVQKFLKCDGRYLKKLKEGGIVKGWKIKFS